MVISECQYYNFIIRFGNYYEKLLLMYVHIGCINILFISNAFLTHWLTFVQRRVHTNANYAWMLAPTIVGFQKLASII